MGKKIFFLLVVVVAIGGFMIHQGKLNVNFLGMNKSNITDVNVNNQSLKGDNFTYDAGTETITLIAGEIKGGDIDGRDAILKCTSGDIVIPDGVGKILTVIDSKGIKATYKIEFGIKTLDQFTYNTDETELILGKDFSNDTISLSFKDIDPNCKDINAAMVARYLKLNGNEKDNILIASRAGSYLSGGSGIGDQDSLYGGKGEDVFFWDSLIFGDDIIFNYTKNQDVIEMNTGEIGTYRVIGNDVVLKSGVTTLTVKNVKPEDILIRRVNGQASNKWMDMDKFSEGVVYAPNKVMLGVDFKHDFYLSDYVDAPKDVDASSMRRNVFIEGDERNNMIVAGNGGISVDGLAGNDVIHCGSQQDVIYWASDRGNDTIYNYGQGDIIRLRNRGESIQSYRVDGNDVILKCGEATLTIKEKRPEEIKVEYMNGSKDTSWLEKKED